MESYLDLFKSVCKVQFCAHRSGFCIRSQDVVKVLVWS